MSREERIIIEPKDGTAELIIRHGEALPVFHQSSVSVKTSGYDGLVQWIELNAHAYGEHWHILMSPTSTQVKVFGHTRRHDPDCISGQLDPFPPLQSLRLNRSEGWGLIAFEELLRSNMQYLLPSEDIAKMPVILRIPEQKKYFSDIAYALRNNKVVRTVTTERQDDKRGNQSQSKTEKVDIHFIETILMQMPVWTADEPQTLKLDVCLRASDAGLFFYFECAEIDAIKDVRKNLLMNHILVRVKEIADQNISIFPPTIFIVE